VIGESNADASGVATLSLPILAAAPAGREVVTQAVIRRGRQGAGSIKINLATAVFR
jgi:hypothetical protein